MDVRLPLNVWTIGGVLTAAMWVWYILSGSRSRGDYDFGPVIFGFIVLCCTAAFWFAVILAKVLR